MRLYLIRHADPDYPNRTITLAGHLEANALAERMEREGITRLFASPLGRARDTMEYTAARLGLPCEIEEWTQEIGEYGIQDPDLGRAVAWDVHGEKIRQEPLPTRDDWDSRPPFNEPRFREVFDRIRACSDEFIGRLGYEREGGTYRIVRRNRERVAVFCHGGLGLTWLAHLLELPLTLVWAGFWLPPSSVTTILFDERTSNYATPRCIGLGDVSHLCGAGLSMRPAGMKANFD